MLKKSLALTVLVVLIATSVCAKNIKVNFSSEIQGDKKMVRIDARNLYNQDWIFIEAFDYNKDGKTDWIRFSDCIYRHTSKNGSSYAWGAEAEKIEFYKGDQERQRLSRVYYGHPCDDMKKIANTEIGVCDHNEINARFKPIKDEDEKINHIFFLADSLLNIEKNPAANCRMMELLNMRVIDFPETWRIKRK